MIRGVLFDLDGTLLDTAGDLIASLNFLREQEGLVPVSVPDYRHMVSLGALGLINQGMPPAAESVQSRRKEDFLAYYAANSTRYTGPFEGIEGVLEALALRGVPWGIVTNKMEALTFPILRATSLLSRAACVVCGDTLPNAKPHPAPVRLACEIMQLPVEQALMVGDDLRDLQAGRAAGSHTAFAAYGYVAPGITAADLAGSHVIQRPAELLGLLERERIA